MHMRKKDYLLFVNDLQAKGPSDEVSLAEFIGLCSAACNRPVVALFGDSRHREALRIHG